MGSALKPFEKRVPQTSPKGSLLLVMLLSCCGTFAGNPPKDSSDPVKPPPAYLGNVVPLIQAALVVEPPPGVMAKGESLSLLGLTQAPRKSREACDLRNEIRNVRRSMGRVASQLCLIELETKDRPEIDTYRMEWGEGEGLTSLAVKYVEKGDEITVFVCRDDRLTEKFQVSERNVNAAKGSYISVGSNEEVTWQLSGRFDNRLAAADKVTMRAKAIYLTESVTYRNQYEFDFNYNGVSRVLHSHDELPVEGEPTFQSVLMRTTNSLGNLLYHFGESTGEPPRAYFDGAGFIVADESREEFGSEGELAVSTEGLANSFPDDFAITPFAADDWDCQGAEPLDPSNTEAEFEACEALEFEPTSDKEDCTDESAYQYTAFD